MPVRAKVGHPEEGRACSLASIGAGGPVQQQRIAGLNKR